MSVLIKDMKKPSNCFECRFSDGAWCNAQDKRNWRQAYHIPQTGISETCPLIEIGEDAQIVIRGYWKEEEGPFGSYIYTCSHCGHFQSHRDYECEFCGAIMDEGGSKTVIVYCDDTTCSYNEDGYCEADKIEIGGMCLTYRGKVEESEKNE